MNKVSVIMPTYNCAKYIGAAIESVLNQTYTNFELIIINDGSTDDTDQILSQYLTNNTSICYIKQENKGHASARNSGIAAATGDLLAFIDSDDIWLPEKLEEQVRECENDPEVCFVHCNVYGFGENRETKIRGQQLTQKQLEKYSGFIFDNLYFREIIITTTTVLIRKECVDLAGAFDENLTRYGSEDRELFLRILKQCKAKYINKPLVMSRSRTGSAGDNYERMIKGQLYVYDKISKIYDIPESVKKAVISKVYQEWARSFYAKGCFVDGFTNQIEAIKKNPMDTSAYLSIKRYLRYIISNRA